LAIGSLAGPPGSVRVPPHQAVLPTRSADDALAYWLTRAPPLLRGVLVLRLDVAPADLDGVELVLADAAQEDLFRRTMSKRTRSLP